jgi:HSP20 family protein
MMHVARWSPFTPAFQLRRDIDDLFGRFFGQVAEEGGRASAEWPSWSPAVEGSEEDGQWVIRAALPGVDPKDVEVSVADGKLSIKGERKQAGEAKNGNYFARELSYGTFERSFTLPEGVDPAKVTARHANGMLEVRVPKPMAEAPRKVAIDVEDGSQKSIKAA